MCKPHYRKLCRYGDPHAGRRPHHMVSFRDDQGRKQCMLCGTWLPEDSFQKASETTPSQDGLYTRCRRCTTDKKRGLQLERRMELLELQKGACICGKVFDIHGGRKVTYFIDHDHSCCPGEKSCGECIRGLLCGSCNVALGHAGDDPALLSRMMDYLAGAAF